MGVIRPRINPGMKERFCIETALFECRGVVGNDVMLPLRPAEEAKNITLFEGFTRRLSQ